MRTIQIFTFLLLIILAGCKETAKESTDVIIIPSGTDIEKVHLSDLNGRTFDIKHYYGKTVFVNFWATWCKPCIAEMPSIQNLQTRLKDENIIFLLASDEEINEINGFKHDNKYSFNYTRLINMEALNIQAIPTTYIYNPEGKLVYSETGSRNWDDSASIQMILKIISQK